ncbi:MAG: ArsR family transcriptional regulator [Candidatus Thorarchaeota archaeon]|nr:MAG: ArsR family transcriptional regulator [Candidatus Thorarchaeota archaeon]
MEKKLHMLHAEVCKTLASPTRIEILHLLRNGEKSVGELANLMGVAQANTSQHLAILRQRGIVNTRKEGTMVYYGIANPKIIKAFNLLREVLLERMNDDADLVKQVVRR